MRKKQKKYIYDNCPVYTGIGWKKKTTNLRRILRVDNQLKHINIELCSKLTPWTFSCKMVKWEFQFIENEVVKWTNEWMNEWFLLSFILAKVHPDYLIVFLSIVLNFQLNRTSIWFFFSYIFTQRHKYIYIIPWPFSHGKWLYLHYWSYCKHCSPLIPNLLEIM